MRWDLRLDPAWVAGLRRIEDRFLAASASKDPETTRRARIAFGAAVVGFVAGIVMSLRYLTLLTEPARTFAAMAVLSISVIVLPALEILRRGHPGPAVHIVLASLLVAITFNAYHLGGPSASVLYWSMIIPAISAFAGSKRSGLACWGACQLAFAGFGVLALSGHRFPDPPAQRVVHELWFSSVCGLSVAMLAFVLIFERSKEATLSKLQATHRALRVARDRAHRASSSKSEFLARVSHEIRTPMTAILGFSELLASRLSGTDAARERLDTIRRNARHLLDVINDILDLSKIEAGLLEVELQACDPVEITREVLSLVEVRAREGGVSLRQHFDPALPARFRSDPTRLRQVLINVIGNAIKFSCGGEVAVDVRVVCTEHGDRRLQIDVSDTGIGMSPDQLERLFEPFRQAEASTARRFGGTGLGLSISRRLCQLMGGQIRAHSVPGAGSTFTIDLPLDLDASLPHVPEANDPDASDPEAIAPDAYRGAVGETQTQDASAALRLETRARVLFADDVEDNRDLVQQILTAAGAQVDVVADGAAALDRSRAGRETYDTIVLDLEMPGYSGFEVARALRSEGYDGFLLALSARAMVGERERCFRAGFDALIPKPFESHTLIDAITRRTRRRGSAGKEAEPRETGTTPPLSTGASTGTEEATGSESTSDGETAGAKPLGMWERFVRFCMPVNLRDDSAAVQRAGVVLGVALAPLPLILLWGFLLPILLDPSVGTSLGHMITLAAPLLFCVPLVVRRSGSLLLAANSLAAYAFVILGILGYFMGGASATALYWLLVLPIATPALGIPSGIVWTFLTVAQFAAFLVADRYSPLVDWTRPELITANALLSASTLNSLVAGIMLLYRKAQDDSLRTLSEANATLARAQEANERASRIKSEFIAHVSHEMRTPMTAILGFSDLLAEEWQASRAPKELRREIGIINRNGGHLLSLVNSLLDLSRVEAGRIELESIVFSPRDLCRDVTDLLEVRAHAKGLQLTLACEPRVPNRVEGDPARVRQILLNLVGNAIKFTHAGSVAVRVRARGERLRFEVRDTGVGLDQAELGLLFQPFRQASAGRQEPEAGSGLGLSISHGLCQLMGGNLTVTSKKNLGSCFVVDLPAQPVSAENRTPDSHADASALANDFTPMQGRVLLADDGPDNRTLIRCLLERLGLEVTTAENGQLALDAVERAQTMGTPFDLILMDMQMPVLNGYEAVRVLRGRGYTGPIVAVTAQALEEERIRCLEAGCDAFATKPITRQSLAAIGRRWITSERRASSTSHPEEG